MVDTGHPTEVAIPHFLVGFVYLEYLLTSVLECVAYLYCLVPVFCVVVRFLLRLCNVGLYASRTTLGEARLVALNCSDSFGLFLSVYGVYY